MDLSNKMSALSGGRKDALLRVHELNSKQQAGSLRYNENERQAGSLRYVAQASCLHKVPLRFKSDFLQTGSLRYNENERQAGSLRYEPRGGALIVAMVIVLMLAGMSAVLMSEIHTRSLRFEVNLEDIKAFEAAEAGIDAALNDINRSAVEQPEINGVPLVSPDGKPVTVHVQMLPDGRRPGCLGTKDWEANPDNDWNNDGKPNWKSTAIRETKDGTGKIMATYFHEPGIVPQVIGDVAFFTYAVDWLHDGVDNNGNGQIDDATERNKYTVYSTGIHKGIAKSGVTEEGTVVTVEVILQASDMDIPALPGAALELQVAPRK
jgi:hypothetical protein